MCGNGSIYSGFSTSAINIGQYAIISLNPNLAIPVIGKINGIANPIWISNPAGIGICTIPWDQYQGSPRCFGFANPQWWVMFIWNMAINFMPIYRKAGHSKSPIFQFLKI